MDLCKVNCWVPYKMVALMSRGRCAGGYKSDFVWKIKGNRLDTDDTTSIEHRALTLTVRTPQCGHTAWGMTNYLQ